MPIKIKELTEFSGEVYLFLIEHNELAYTQKEISESLNKDQSAVTRQLKILIDQKIVTSVKNYAVKGNPYYYYYSPVSD